jgi:N-acetylmuramoyl-L-alanine amidase
MSPFDIWNEVPLVAQRSGMSCWAAAAAMVVGWRECIAIDDADFARMPVWRAAYRDGLEPRDVETLARMFDLRVEQPQVYSIDAFRDLLERFGPLWVGEASPGLHVVVIVGIHGDGTPDGTFVRVNDPWPLGRGERYTIPFRELAANLEAAEGTTGIRAQVLHGGGRSNDRKARLWPNGHTPEADRAAASGGTRDATYRGMVRIVVDPGHGGMEAAGRSSAFGGRGPRGTWEKDVTLSIAHRVAQYLGQEAVLTRRADVNLSLGARATLAREQGADAFVSIHANSGGTVRRGAETYVHRLASEDSRALGLAIQSELSSFGSPSGGVMPELLGVLQPDRHAPQTAACLIEVDDLSDPEGERRLTEPAAVDRLGQAIARGIRRYFSVRGRGARPRFGDGGRRRALLVGINNYAGNANNLGGCIADVNAMQDVLGRYYGFEAPRTLLDQQASKSAILAALTSLMQQSDTGDVLVFHYSGHGSYIAEPTPQNPNRVSQTLYCADGQNLFDRELAQIVQNYGKEGVNFTIILDSCFSGGFGDVVGVPDQRVRGLPLSADLQQRLGQTIQVAPVGICRPSSAPDFTQPVTISNAGLVCEAHPNTVTVDVARATLFTAVDYTELAPDVNSYTQTLKDVIANAPTYQSNAEIQRRIVEAFASRTTTVNPMLRCQTTRLNAPYLQAYDFNPAPTASVSQGLAQHAPATW